MNVRDKYDPFTSEVKYLGICVFKSTSDKEKGVIAFATNETFIISHTENTIRLHQDDDGSVEISIRSDDRFFYRLGVYRIIDNEIRILDEINTEIIRIKRKKEG
jgi:hypothetical protein